MTIRVLDLETQNHGRYGVVTCKVCGEDLVGDGYSTVIHCPNKDIDDLYLEPDADVVHCEEAL